MIKLIKNELIKIFKKNAIWILLGAMFVISGIGFYFDKQYEKDSDLTYYYLTDSGYSESFNENLSSLNPEVSSDVEDYIFNQNQIDKINLAKKYGVKSWQTYIIVNSLSSIINDMNVAKYSTKDDKSYSELEAKYNEYIEKFDNDDWQYFAKLDIANITESLNSTKSSLTDDLTDNQKNEIESSIAQLESELYYANYRLDHNISYADNYLNRALVSAKDNKKNIIIYDYANTKTVDMKQNIDSAKESYSMSQYELENEIDSSKASLNFIIANSAGNIQLFIILIVIVISGTIVSEEFNKGTIKLLLIKPYKRWQILLSKFISVLLVAIICVALSYLWFTLVGGLLFGFDSLKNSAIVYNYTTNSIIEMNPYIKSLITLVGYLPEILLLGTLAFSIGSIINISALAIAIPLIGIPASEIINALAIQYNIKVLSYFVTPNWDLNNFFFGKTPLLEGTTITSAIIVCLVYFLIMIVVAFIIFKRKNIKNI